VYVREKVLESPSEKRMCINIISDILVIIDNIPLQRTDTFMMLLMSLKRSHHLREKREREIRKIIFTTIKFVCRHTSHLLPGNINVIFRRKKNLIL
jgi:hypothetical protein